MPRRNRKANAAYLGGIIWIIAAGIFFFDLFIKSYLRNNFSFQSIHLIKNILHITVVFNRGAAFGILQGKGTFLVYIGLIFILVFLVFIKKQGQKNLSFLIPCGLILGGAISNLYDRIFFGFVVDYIDIRIWPVFNLSDSCITIGAGLLFLSSFKKNGKNADCSKRILR
ncbi:MAG: signal peptidase II [Candidatus Omnitrophica bacterium]|nr:signal peptidase II [Candidatus Omnitrophota bacterium]MBU0878904.1 signal peptidase II [Candidatus Omnitrophota bacterium]MBU0896146.1 signal peptidase II [Candidatus Omnitrophota bacterium]MBU1133858.1 signal peptidase II [Candidatus Omnitrophota bacterium]MBU1366760.1 signal peptidase II [Candidatus Omnitrophota bacterium]